MRDEELGSGPQYPEPFAPLDPPRQRTYRASRKHKSRRVATFGTMRCKRCGNGVFRTSADAGAAFCTRCDEYRSMRDK